MTRFTILAVAALGLGGCSGEANHLGTPLLWPFQGAASAVQNATYNERRGAIELFVKTNHPALMADIGRGGGPALTEAMGLANVPPEDRPARVIQLQADAGLYAANPGALTVALMVYGS